MRRCKVRNFGLIKLLNRKINSVGWSVDLNFQTMFMKVMMIRFSGLEKLKSQRDTIFETL